MLSLLVLLCASVAITAIPVVPSLPLDMGSRTYMLNLNLRKFQFDLNTRSRLRWFVRAAAESLPFVTLSEDEGEAFFSADPIDENNVVRVIRQFDTEHQHLRHSGFFYTQDLSSEQHFLRIIFDNREDAHRFGADFEAAEGAPTLTGHFLDRPLAEGHHGTYVHRPAGISGENPTTVQELFENVFEEETYTARFVSRNPELPAGKPLLPVAEPFLQVQASTSATVNVAAAGMFTSGIDVDIDALLCREHPHHQQASAFFASLSLGVNSVAYSVDNEEGFSATRFYNQVDAYVAAVSKLLRHADWADTSSPNIYEAIFHSNCV